jgi:hypothetical protein
LIKILVENITKKAAQTRTDAAFAIFDPMKFILIAALVCGVAPMQAMTSLTSLLVKNTLVIHKDSIAVSRACERTNTALEQSYAFVQRLMSSAKRDTTSIDSLVQITRTAHDSALVCNRHLTAMMLLATSEAARKLTSAENVLVFRLNLRDVQLFLAEARKYWLQEMPDMKKK